MYKVYILKSKNHNKTYVGHTDNLERRLQEHNSGRSSYTNKFRPWDLLYYEEYQEINESIMREKYFKTGSGRKKIKKILNSL